MKPAFVANDETGPVSEQAESMRQLAGQIIRIGNTSLDEVAMNARAVGETDLEEFLTTIRDLLFQEAEFLQNRAAVVEARAKARLEILK